MSRRIDASAERLFAFLADPTNHPAIDGSGMLREAEQRGPIAGIGDEFVVKMHNDEMGDYEITSHVVQYELNRRLSWEPVLTAASRDEDQAELGDRAGHRWGFELTPSDDGSTIVIETFDCSQAPEWLRKVLDNGKRWTRDMTVTLEELDATMTLQADGTQRGERLRSRPVERRTVTSSPSSRSSAVRTEVFTGTR